MSYRIFSTYDRGFGLECPRCKKVLRVPIDRLHGSIAGWQAKEPVVCPCGYSSQTIDPEEKSAAPKPAASSGIAQAVTWLVCGGVAVFLLYQCQKEPSAETIATRAAEHNNFMSENHGSDGAVLWVEKYVKKNLKDPDSYLSIEWSRVQAASGGLMTVRHKYRAKNSFGGYVVANQVFIYDKSGTVFSVTDYAR